MISGHICTRLFELGCSVFSVCGKGLRRRADKEISLNVLCPVSKDEPAFMKSYDKKEAILRFKNGGFGQFYRKRLPVRIVRAARFRAYTMVEISIWQFVIYDEREGRVINIGDWMFDIFGPYGALGVILFVFLIFFIDALFFPTLPELFFIIGFMYDPTLAFGLQLLGVAIAAEIAGIVLLYLIVERARIPERIRKIADRYIKFLVCSDERMLLVNRAAPVIPFAGAFISLVENWRISKALFYVVIGCIIKYGIIMLMSNFFFRYFESGDAQTYTIVLIIAVIAISMVLAFHKKKRGGIVNENC